MYSKDQIEAMPERVYKRISDISRDYLEYIGGRIAETEELIPTDAIAVQRIYETGADINAIEAELERASQLNAEDIHTMFEAVAKEGYDWVKPFFKAKGALSYKDNERIQSIVRAQERLTVGTYENLSQCAAFLVYDERGNFITRFGTLKANPTDLHETYKLTMDKMVQSAQLGIIDHNKAIREVLTALADSGIRDTVSYASGYSRRLDTAVRQNVLWGMKQCNQEVSDMLGEELDADGYEIDYHPHPRPSHEDMGGRQYAKGRARTVKGVYYPSFSEVEQLLEEYGCRHFKYPIWLGMSEPIHTPAELARLKAKDKETITFEGEQITRYEASQKQRKLETAMRHCDDRITIAKAALKSDAGREMYEREKERMRFMVSKYRELSSAAGLPTKMERTVSYIKSGKSLTTAGGGGKIEIRQLKMAETGGHRGERPLTKKEKTEVIKCAVQYGMPKEMITFSDGVYTAYGEYFDRLYIGTDVMPGENPISANEKISMRGAIAHELAGHRDAHLKGRTQENAVYEEIQASIRGARFGIGLTNEERYILLRDAAERAHKNGLRLRDIKGRLYINER